MPLSRQQWARRLGWLLRMNRLYGNSPRFQHLAEFATALASSPSTVSRWETGSTAVSYDRIADYELVLGLSRHSLTSFADVATRYLTPTTQTAPILTRKPEPRGPGFDELIEKSTSTGIMTGADWIRLTGVLAATPDMYFRPNSIWNSLTERLIVENNLASGGVAWMLRSEALNRLLAHPAGQERAISTVRETVLDSSAHSMAGTVSALEITRNPAANALVVAQITNPVGDRIRYGALLTSFRKLRDGHFSHSQIAMLVGALLETWRDSTVSTDIRNLTATLLTMLPPNTRTRIGRSDRKAIDEQLAGPSIIEHDFVAVLAASAGAALGADDPAAPELRTLREILTEALFHPVFDMRMYANYLISCTPCRAPIARQLLVELVAGLRRGNVAWATVLLESLRLLGGVEERRLIERFLVSPGAGSVARTVAASTLGHIGGVSSDAYWRTAITAGLAQWRAARIPTNVATIDRLVYALGVHNRRQVLLELNKTTDLPRSTATAVAWWLRVPTHIIESASR